MGVGIGSFAQGLAGGIGQGVQIATAIDRDKREQQRFDLEKPALELTAANAKRENAWQNEYQERLKGLMVEAQGGEVQGPDGTIEQRPAMDPFDVQLKATDLMKEVMFKNGVVDFKRLEEARTFSKQAEQDGILAAVRYAKANPGDIEGAKKLFKGKAKLGDDIEIAVENNEFGSMLVGYKTGADGKRVRVFDEGDLLAPYISAQTFAQIKSQEKQTLVKEAGDTKRNAITAGATIEAQRLRNSASMAETQRKIDADDARDRRAGAITPAKQYDALNTSFNTIFTGLTRNMLDPAKDGGKYADIYTTAKAMAVEAWRNPSSPTYGNPEASIQGATREVLKRNGMLSPANTR